MKPSVYIETTVISYLAARPSRDVVSLARQELTHEFWTWAPSVYWLRSSELVRDEISRGDAFAAQQRLAYFGQCEMLLADERVAELADKLMAVKAIPNTEPEDAAHIAIATLAQVKYIVSWNFAHIVSPQAKRQLEQAITQMGYQAPLLATPEEIFEAEA